MFGLVAHPVEYLVGRFVIYTGIGFGLAYNYFVPDAFHELVAYASSSSHTLITPCTTTPTLRSLTTTSMCSPKSFLHVSMLNINSNTSCTPSPVNMLSNMCMSMNITMHTSMHKHIITSIIKNSTSKLHTTNCSSYAFPLLLLSISPFLLLKAAHAST